MKIKIFFLSFIILLIGLFIYFFIFKKDINNQNKKSLKIKTKETQIDAKSKDIAKEKKRQEAIARYLNTLRQKIDNSFPKGLVVEDAVSECWSKLFKTKNKSIVPKGASVQILNFTRIKKIRPEHNRLQVFYKEDIYCILQNKVRKKDKIILILGGVPETSIYVRYILFPNGKFVNIIQRAPFYPNDYAFEYIRVFGSFTRKKNTIKLCNFEYLLYPMPNFPGGEGCLKLKKNGEIWKSDELKQRIEFRLTEY